MSPTTSGRSRPPLNTFRRRWKSARKRFHERRQRGVGAFRQRIVEKLRLGRFLVGPLASVGVEGHARCFSKRGTTRKPATLFSGATSLSQSRCDGAVARAKMDVRVGKKYQILV